MNRLIVIALLLFTVLAPSCKQDAVTRQFPYDQMKEGDLAFRCGRGVFSQAVILADDKGLYSHIGIVVREGDAWKVVHAVPGEREGNGDFDRVKMEDLEVFYSPQRASHGCLVHTGITSDTLINRICADAKIFARDSVRFDNNYDLTDSSEVYCTELVWRLYRRVGTDLSEGRRRNVHILKIDGPVLLPEHILDYTESIEYYSF